MSIEQMIEAWMTVHIFELIIFRFRPVKKINIYSNIKDYMLKNKNIKDL
jgi:hypothetical protein